MGIFELILLLKYKIVSLKKENKCVTLVGKMLGFANFFKKGVECY